ncbi:MAG: TerB family tellurite resistance protein [Candidatus Cloacimonetes bacterium]|nr:TerB family tellurite resistance protein [Candidatus Cloacimonadota bacterium]
MARWSEKIGNIIKYAGEQQGNEHELDSFFISKAYIPKTEQEKQEYEEFSLVSASMAILIHIAKADKVMHPEEISRIIDDLTFQLEQRPFEYESLSEKFGLKDREIIRNLFDKLLKEYENNLLDLDKIIEIINRIYQNNPEKRYYLIRLCFYCALSDTELDNSEEQAIKEIAAKLNIPLEEMNRIENEVKAEMEYKKS